MPGASFVGKVQGNLQPRIAASVQLYQSGNTGYGSRPSALLTDPLITDDNGNFTVPAGYSCTSADRTVYLLAKGGKSGEGGTINAAAWMMAPLGGCGSITTGQTFVVNEVTTAASAWALSQFLAPGGNVGASCNNSLGLINAVRTEQNLVKGGTGTSPGANVPANLAVNVAKLNTLANALTTCTGSGGATCSSLFSAATIDEALPENTLDAALAVTRNPATNVAAVYAVAASNLAFLPALSSAPPDWLLWNTIVGGGLARPASVSVAASGNVWVSNTDAVSEFTPDGAAVWPAGMTGYGINQAYGMALDVSGNVWIANQQTSPNRGLGDIAKLDASGRSVSGTGGFVAGGINFPVAVAADPDGNMWIANYGNSKVTLLDPAGTPISGTSGFGGDALAFPFAIAIDSNHNAWVANQQGGAPVTKISGDGSNVINIDCCDDASGVAIDQGNDVWITNYYGDSVSRIRDTSFIPAVDVFRNGGLASPLGIAIDGGGSVWVTNYHGGSISKFSGSSTASPGTPVSPATGFGQDAALLQPFALAIDASGNLWVSNFGNDTLTQFIGAAMPVKTPFAGPPQLP